MKLDEILEPIKRGNDGTSPRLKNVSDIFIIAGRPVTYKCSGEMVQDSEDAPMLRPEMTEEIINSIYETAKRDISFRDGGDDDFAVTLGGVARFRVNIFRQRGSWSAVLRVVSFELPPISEMGIPEELLPRIGNLQKGLVLVTGTAGSGKSTTLRYIIDYINHHRQCHILTLEDPIEYLHKHDRSIVSQREINIDTANYAKALRAAMREAPDVILVGEMRDLETMEIAMTAAETGHLVLSTLHTLGAANTVDRVIDVFPPGQQSQIRVQLSMVLRYIISQQLIPKKQGGETPAFEIMENNSAIRTLIREGKVHQIDSTIYNSGRDGMVAMDACITDLYRRGIIDEAEAMNHCMNRETMARALNIRL